MPSVPISVYLIAGGQFAKLISNRMPSIAISYIVLHDISSISVFSIAYHQFPSLCIVLPAISSHLCLSYRLPSVPITNVVSPAINYHPSISITSHLFPSIISYRLPLVTIFVYRIACHPFPLLILYRLPSFAIFFRTACHNFLSLYNVWPAIISNLFIVSPATSSHLCITYPLPSVPISYIVSPALIFHLFFRTACHNFPALYIVSPAIISNLFIVSQVISSQLSVSYRLPSVPITYNVSPAICSHYLHRIACN